MKTEILQTRQAFYYFLKSEGLKESSIAEHVRELKRFFTWVDEQEYSSSAHLTYQELLGYVQFLKAKQLTIATVNIRLNTVKKYYEYLKQEGVITVNPARKLYVRGGVRKIVQQPFTRQELDTLYHQYIGFCKIRPVREEKNLRAYRRNIVILGLLIFQGVHAGELKKMERGHINIHRGSVYIPGSRSKSRILKLEPEQMAPLNEYLNSLPSDQEILFVKDVHNTLQLMTQELKGMNVMFQNINQIRG